MEGRGAFFQWIANQLTAGMGWRGRNRIILFCGPVLMTVAAVIFAADSALFILRSEPVTGTVVQVYEWEGTTVFDRGQVNYEPVFTYLDGGEARRASVGSAHASFEMAVGDTAAIRNVPGGQHNVKIDTWQGIWFVPVVLSVLALASWMVAGLIWAILSVLFFRKGAA